ncbi:hemagglutinin repeat-containing protein [Rhizobium rhizogenes]|uniref:hemagglutinin repeat-containing protein n=1 Tax=Rhizobium rhizogenes TaxID=359 RepID=UPI00157365DC|nr:hemagglutinin repeat-containing protein [Rhizobium rhizogenes]NTF46117.1 filamentous hemagglutinin N-terminal domain-containing protein [Rhizobium rhizogenes]
MAGIKRQSGKVTTAAVSAAHLIVMMGHRFTAMLLSCLLVFQPMLANAQSVSAAGSAPVANQAGVGAAPNGVPLIDIVTPNAVGLSHNKYDNFNIGTPGLILNNYNAKVGTSSLGGATPGNPNLRYSGPASVILNEVTSGNRSALNGPAEVFGGRADVIIANPNGITCNGCGFINTPHATLTSGVPNIGSDGRLTGFTVNGGDVTFEGTGGNFAAGPGAVDLFDVVARNIHVNAPIYGKTIRLTGGASKYDYASGEAAALTAISGTPDYAIDGSALGAMQAGRIRIVVTEKGAGVKMSGDMAANAGELSLSADGKISIGNASASNGVTITSRQGVTAGRIASTQKVTVRADQGVTLQSVAADGDIVLANGAGLLSVADDVTGSAAVELSSGAGIHIGKLDGGASTVLSSTAGDVSITGGAHAGGDLTIDVASGSLSAGSLESDGDMRLDAALDIAVLGNVLAKGNVSASGRSIATGMIGSGVNNDASKADLDLVATGGTMTTGNLLSSGRLVLAAAGTVTAGDLQSGSDLAVTAAALTAGNVASHGSLTVHAATAVQGQILAANDILISGGAIAAAAVVSGVDFAATQANGGNPVLSGAGDIILQASGSLSLKTLLAAGTISAVAADLTLGNVTGHKDITLAGTASLTATGQILGANDIALSGGTVSAGLVATGVEFAAMAQSATGAILIGSAGDLTIDATSGSARAGPLLVAGNLTVTAGAFTGSTITGHGNVTITAAGTATSTTPTDPKTAGTTPASGSVHLTGTLMAAGNVDITGADITAGTLVSGVDIDATSQAADGNVVLSTQSPAIVVPPAQSPATAAGSTGTLTLRATAGNVNAANLLSAGSTNVTASGSIGNTSALNAVAHQNLTMTAGGTITLAGQSMAGGNLKLQAQSITADTLASGVDFAATAASPSHSLILSAQSPAIGAEQDNTQSGTMTLSATLGDVSVKNALLAGGNLDVTANGGISYALLQSLANASLTAPAAISYDREAHVAGNLTINAGATATVDLSGTRAANIFAGSLTINAQSASFANAALTLGGLAFNLTGQADLTDAQLSAVATGSGQPTAEGSPGGNGTQANIQSGSTPTAQGKADISIVADGLLTSASTSLRAAHDLTLTLPTLVNNGQLAAGNDLTNTPTGLIYAANDAALLVAKTLANNQGAIVAGNNLTITGLPQNPRNAEIINTAGLIQAGNNISILTSNLVNKRSVTPTLTQNIPVPTNLPPVSFVINPYLRDKPYSYLHEYPGTPGPELYAGYPPPLWSDYLPYLYAVATLPDGTKYHVWNWTEVKGQRFANAIIDHGRRDAVKDANGNPIIDPNNPVLNLTRRLNNDATGAIDTSLYYYWNSGSNISQSVYEDRFASPPTPEAVIHAGGKLAIDTTSLINSYSTIEAGGDAELKGTTLTNQGVALNRTTTLTCNAASACTAYKADGSADPSHDIASGTSIVGAIETIGGAPAILKAGGELKTDFTTVNNTSLGSTGGHVAVSAPSAPGNPLSALAGMTAGRALFNVPAAPAGIAANGSLSAILANLHLLSPQALAHLAALATPSSGGVGGTIPGQAFVFETRAAFLDVGKFYGSAYFLNRIGYKPDTSIPFLGDAYFDNQLIDTQLRQLVGDGLGHGAFIPGNSAIDQMKNLFDNGAAYAQANGLAFGQGLAPQQAASLTQSIVLYQLQTVGGVQLFAPVVYLSAADRARAGASAGAVIAGNAVDITGGALNNSGDIAAAGGLDIAANTIKSTGTFYAGGNLNLTAANGITLAAQTMTIGGQNVVNPDTGASAGGNLRLAAGNGGLNLNGATVKAGGNAELSGSNVNLAAVKVDASAAGGRAENATGARIDVGGNLTIAANNDVNVIGSSAKSGGDLNVTATNGAVNIVSTDLTRQTDDGYTKTSGTDQQASQLSAGGNLAITAGGDAEANANTGILISGSDLTAKGDVGLASNGDINITTSQSQSNSTIGKTIASHTSFTSNASSITSDNGSITIQADNGAITVIGSDIAAKNGAANLIAKGDVTIGQATDATSLSTSSGRTKTSETTTTAQGSSISGQTGVNILSTRGNVTISVSDVTAGDPSHKADANIQAAGNIVIASGKDTDEATFDSKKSGFLSSSKTHTHDYNETTVGSDLSATGDLKLDAGKGAVIAGSKVNAGGALNVSGQSVSIIGAHEDHEHDSQTKKSGLFVGSGSGFLSLYGKSDKQGQQSSTDNVGSQLSAGKDVNLTARGGPQAAGDLDIMGSSVNAGRDINLSARRDVNITPGAERSSQSEQQKKSGFGLSFSAGNGGFSIGIGAQSTKDSKAQQSDTNAVSELSAGRDLNISAGNNVNLQATSASAERDVNLFAGKDINLLSANDVTNYEEVHEKTFAGVTLSVSSQIGKAAESIMNSAKRLSDSGDVNAVTNTAIAGLGFYQAYNDLKKAESQLNGTDKDGKGLQFDVSLSIGASHQQSDVSSSSSSPVVTDIRAGRSITIAPATGSFTSDGAQIHAGYDKDGNRIVSNDPLTGDIFLSVPKGDVNLNAATGTFGTAGSNSSWSAGLGLGVSCGTKGGCGKTGLYAGGSYGKGGSETSGTSHTNTHVNGTGDVTIVTNDLALKGATVAGNSVGIAARSLTIESQLDTQKAKADQLNVSAQIGFGNTSVSGVTQKAKGDAVLVSEQSGIHAGTGGLNIDVSGQTSLVGGLITSEAGEGRNSFSTGTLTVTDIDTHSTWKADTYGGSIGTGGFSITPPIKAGENETGKAYSAIGGNVGITITDPAHQTQDVSTIRRDTDNTNTSLPGLPDLQNILRDQYKTQADLQAAQATMAGLVADIANNLMLNATTQAEKDFWGEGGAGRAALHALGGGLLGDANGVEGAVKGALGGAASTMLAQAVKELVAGMLKDAKFGSEEDRAKLGAVFGATIMAGIGSIVGGGEGAAYGAANYQYNYLADEDLFKAADALAAAEKCETDCAALWEKVNDYKQLSQYNDAVLITTCTAAPASSACQQMKQDLLKFASRLDRAGIDVFLDTAPSENPIDLTFDTATLQQFSGTKSAINLDVILARYLSEADKNGVPVDVAIDKALTQISRTEGGMKALLDGAGVVGGVAACAGTVGTACALGLIGAAVSANQLVASAQQSLTGEDAKTALVYSLEKAGYSQEEAERYEHYMDIGAVVLTVGVVGSEVAVRFTAANLSTIASAAERQAVAQALEKIPPLRTINGKALNPKLPDPAAGYGYVPKTVASDKPNIANSHINGFNAEIDLANQIADLPGQQVLRYGDAVGTHGADIISVDVNTGDVFLWDNKFRGGSVSVKSSPTFDVNSDAFRNALRQAQDAVDDLPSALKDKALENLRQGNFTTNTVGSGNARNSVPIRFCGGNPC